MPSLSEATDNLIWQCRAWCNAKRLEPTHGLDSEGLGRMAVLDYLALGKGFRELNDTQRRAVAGMEVLGVAPRA